MKKRYDRSMRTAAAAVSVILTAVMLGSCGDNGEDSKGGGPYRSDVRTQQENITGNNRYDMNTNDGMAENDNKNAEEFYDAEMTAPEMNDGLYAEEYNKIIENEFKSVAEYPLSTFSTDVDTASFTNVRRMIDNREEINPDAVRTEEFINYFKYSYPLPENGDRISITTELSDCPWNEDSKLMLVGLQAQEIETRDIDSNIVFLIDVSGSMSAYDKLPLVQQAFSMLAGNLNEGDTVSIVTYAGSDEVVLEGTSGAKSDYICECLNGLTAGGATAGADGINTAYEIAERYFIEGGNNRVILATDGDLNVGVSSEEGLTELIEQKRDNGIFLSVLGFGTGNYKDNKLEALADNGNGNYAYIDSVDEAERVLVTEMSGTLYTVAKDAKVQVEFNPANVAYYKLVGYENRLLDDEDFEDDTKDAGDVGSGQQVTALYEIITADGAKLGGSGKTLKYQSDVSYPVSENQSAEGLEGELLTVSVRYKEADEDESRLIDKAVTLDSYVSSEKMGDNMRLAAGAAEFAMTLRNSSAEKPFTMQQIRDTVTGIAPDANELLSMISDYEIYYGNNR